MVARGWSEPKKRAYVIADDKLALNAGWDDALLAAELTDLQDLAFDLDLIGFDAAELGKLLGSGDAVDDEDQVPDAPAEPVSRAGDLWVLGRHRLLCGDATAAADVSHLLGSVRPHLMVTDPPYGVKYDPAWRNDVGAAQTRRTGKVMNDDRADWREAWALFPGDVAYVWHGWCSAAAIITGSTSPAGMRCGKVAPAHGVATASRRRCGRSQARDRMPRPYTARKSRWSACAAQCLTTAAWGKRSTSRSWARVPR
jgi:hypothetical protein